jgi:predicted acylesterase/phospholipase RssA
MEKKVSPEVLVLGPGGIKGISFLGFLSILDKHKMLDDVKIYCGVSIGSIICMLKTIGYTYDEILNISVDLDLLSKIDHSFKSLTKNLSSEGLISTEPIRNLLNKLVSDRYGKIPSLKEIYTEKGLTYISTTYNLTDKVTEYLSHKNEPDIDCVSASILSSAIPIVFKKITYKNKQYVDGALGNSFPIDYLDDDKHDILGVYIDTNPVRSKKDQNMVKYLARCITTPMEERRRSNILKAGRLCQCVGINVNILFSTSFNLSVNEKIELIEAGVKRAEAFLEERPHHKKFDRFVYD